MKENYVSINKRKTRQLSSRGLQTEGLLKSTWCLFPICRKFTLLFQKQKNTIKIKYRQPWNATAERSAHASSQPAIRTRLQLCETSIPRTSSPPEMKLETKLVRPRSGSLEQNKARKEEIKFNWHQRRFFATGWQAGGAAGLASGT